MGVCEQEHESVFETHLKLLKSVRVRTDSVNVSLIASETYMKLLKFAGAKIESVSVVED